MSDSASASDSDSDSPPFRPGPNWAFEPLVIPAAAGIQEPLSRYRSASDRAVCRGQVVAIPCFAKQSRQPVWPLGLFVRLGLWVGGG